MGDMKKRLPEFKSEDEERNFWATADSTKYVTGRRQNARSWFASNRRCARYRCGFRSQ